MRDLVILFLFLIGSAIGSFLNVVISRLKSGEPIAVSRSHCVYCNAALRARDLVPVISFILLRARCRSCHKKISWQYPLVELATALAFMIAGLQFVPQDVLVWTGKEFSQLAFVLVMISVFIVVFVFDLKHYLILNRVTYPAIIVALLYDVVTRVPVRTVALGLIAGAGLFLLLVVVSKETWMGWGDVKLGVLIGLVVPWPNTLAVLFLAFVLGSIGSIILLALKIKTLKDVVPFGTFLSASAVIYLLLNADLVHYYVSFFLG